MPPFTLWHSAASWGDGQSWFLFHAEFPFGPEAYGRVVAPKGQWGKKTQNISKTICDGWIWMEFRHLAKLIFRWFWGFVFWFFVFVKMEAFSQKNIFFDCRFIAGSAAGFGRLAGEGLQGSNASDGWFHQCFGWTHAAVMWCKGVVLFLKKRLEGSME